MSSSKIMQVQPCFSAICAAIALCGCASRHVTVISRGEALTVPIPLGNPPDSGDKIEKIWVSFASPAYFAFQATSSDTGPKSLRIGESWTASGQFALSSSAPLGCTSLAYSISTSSDEVTDPNYNDEPPYVVRLLVIPEKPSVWQRIRSWGKKALCALKTARFHEEWPWSEPKPTERVPLPVSVRRDIPLAPDPSAKWSQGFPRGNFGFALGQTLASADENAAARELQVVPRTNVSVKPDEWRYYEVTRDPEVSSITIFLKDGTVNEVSVNFLADSLHPSFEKVRKKLRRRLGQEVGFDDRRFDLPIYQADGKTPSGIIDHLHNQSAFWADCKTVIALQGRTRPNGRELSIQYHDLRPGSSIRFTTIGGGKSNSFAACEHAPKNPDQGQPKPRP